MVYQWGKVLPNSTSRPATVSVTKMISDNQKKKHQKAQVEREQNDCMESNPEVIHCIKIAYTSYSGCS